MKQETRLARQRAAAAKQLESARHAGLQINLDPANLQQPTIAGGNRQLRVAPPCTCGNGRTHGRSCRECS